MVKTLVSILFTHKEHELITTACCEILAMVSFEPCTHDVLATANELQILYHIGKMNDNEYLKIMVCTVLCNVASTMERALIENGVIFEFSMLSANSAHNEIIQELIARAICSLTCIVSKQEFLVEHNTLDMIAMICQVRSISMETKHLCAQSLLNLCQPQNIANILNVSVVSCFAAILNFECYNMTAHICARAFLILSSNEAGRACLSQSLVNLQTLFGLVNKPSEKTKIVLAKATFNMLADPATRVVSIKSNALTVLKIVAAFEDRKATATRIARSFNDIREITAQLLVTLAFDNTTHRILFTEPLVGILILFINNSVGFSFECALQACSIYASIPMFRKSMVEKGLVTAIVNASLGSKKTGTSAGSNQLDETNLALAATRTLAFISYAENESRESMVNDSTVMIVLHSLKYHAFTSIRCATIMSILLRNISQVTKLSDILVEQKAIRLLAEILREVDYRRSFVLCQSAVIVMQNLAKSKIYHAQMIGEGFFMEVLLTVASIVSEQEQHDSSFATLDVTPIITALDLVSESQSSHAKMVESGIVATYTSLLSLLDNKTRYLTAKAICNISSSEECREGLVKEGAMELLISMAPYADTATKAKITMAIGFLSELVRTRNMDVGTTLDLVNAIESTDPAELVEQNTQESKKLKLAGMKAHLKDQLKHNTFLKQIKQSRISDDTRGSESLEIDSHGDHLLHEKDDDEDESCFIAKDTDVLDHDYDNFCYEYTLHYCDTVQGGLSRPTQLDILYPTLEEDAQNEFKFEEDFIPIPIDMKSLPKMTMRYEVVQNDFTHDAVRGKQVQSKAKKVAEAVRVQAKMGLMIFEPTVDKDYRDQIARKVAESNEIHKSENNYDSPTRNFAMQSTKQSQSPTDSVDVGAFV